MSTYVWISVGIGLHFLVLLLHCSWFVLCWRFCTYHARAYCECALLFGLVDEGLHLVPGVVASLVVRAHDRLDDLAIVGHLRQHLGLDRLLAGVLHGRQDLGLLALGNAPESDSCKRKDKTNKMFGLIIRFPGKSIALKKRENNFSSQIKISGKVHHVICQQSSSFLYTLFLKNNNNKPFSRYFFQLFLREMLPRRPNFY